MRDESSIQSLPSESDDDDSETSSSSGEESCHSSHGHDSNQVSSQSGATACTSAAMPQVHVDDYYECDVGKILSTGVNIHELSRQHMYHILKTEPNPNQSCYPRTRPYRTGSYRQFQPTWVKQHPWLHYSHNVDGVFCRACVFFAPEKVGGQASGQFVTKPFTCWNKQTERMNAHGMLDYHLTSMVKMEEFLARYENPSEAINIQFNSEANRIMKNNQQVIESLFKIVMLCGKQGLALRGHRDDCIDWVSQEQEEQLGNQGNFIELVRFRAETDAVLHTHLQSAPRNALYTSKTIQNQLIDIIGQCIRSDIVNEVKEAKFYSVIADEVVDVANKEQLSISLRYVFKNEVKEVFLNFVEVDRITGKVLAESILQCLSSLSLSIPDLRGQCYDGASNMAGARSGCRTIVQQQAPMAIYMHCAAHQLNLAVVSACKIQAFKNTETCIGDIARFFQLNDSVCLTKLCFM